MQLMAAALRLRPPAWSEATHAVLSFAMEALA